MTQSIIYKKRYIAFLPVLLLLLLTAIRSQAQQCNWSLTATAEPSTCLANGKVTATLNNNGSVTGNMLYRLSSLSGPFEVPENTSPVFEGLSAGQYKVVAKGICNGREDSISTTITVPGTYQLFQATAFRLRRTLDSCNTGQIKATLTNGRGPYSIRIESMPAEYTGPTTFSTSNSSFILDNLPAGTYTLTMTDACGAGAAPPAVIVPELPPLSTTAHFAWAGPSPLGTGCNQFIVGQPHWFWTTDDDYDSPGTPLSYSISFDGYQFPYKPINSTVDTVIFPAGKTFKDMYGKLLTYHVRSICGQEAQHSTPLYTPVLYVQPTPHCQTSVDLRVGFDYPFLCYPVRFTVRNKATGAIRDTVANFTTYTYKELPYGNYAITITAADGYTVQDTNRIIQPPTIASWSMTPGAAQGPNGNHRGASFTLRRSSGAITAGTRVELISPSTYRYSRIASTGSSTFLITAADNGTFYPDTYTFRISDGCTVTDLDVTVTENDVYNYSWSIPPGVQTCDGFKITPTGTAMYLGTSRPVYFKVLEGPPGYNSTPVPLGSSLTLPSSGTYKIAIGSTTSIFDFGQNTKTSYYDLIPLSVDVNTSMGWVCPNLPDDSGYIRAKAIGGTTAATGVYTYKLAAAGNGATGPYLATNTSGQFSTSASGGAYTLTKNQNYDVQVVDECGATAVQTLKIIDFATAQIASADQAEYCLGDTIRFRVINLPSTAITYQWTGPDNFNNTQRNPQVGPVTEKSGGIYHVTISADICKQPINADVNIVLASYVTSCYSALTDTSVNPYAYGLLGAWRPVRSYTYYAARAESDPDQQTNIRKDGAFNDFMAFWQKETDGWKAQTTDPNWVWNSQTTLFNKKGFELENKDPLGRYNAGIYGYDNAVPVAVIQNSRYSESTFDGFEDYAFVSSNCDDGKCPVDRRFNLSGAAGRIVNTAFHTGRYSLKVTNADKDSIAIMMPVTETATDPSDPAFNMIDNNCPPYDQVLESVRADKNVLLPQISLLSGKQVLVSAWVKEAQDCKCTSYNNSQLKIVVKGADASGSAIYPAIPKGGIIDGWQRIEQVVDLPAGTEALSLILLATGNVDVYFDDIRVHPYNANMKSFVYDAQNLRLMAELDENNYATFYEYDDDGTLTRVKKETERGIKTIKETRSALIKEVADVDPNIEN